MEKDLSEVVAEQALAFQTLVETPVVLPKRDIQTSPVPEKKVDRENYDAIISEAKAEHGNSEPAISKKKDGARNRSDF